MHSQTINLTFICPKTEVDTHLNVLHIDLNNNYDNAADLFVALDIMQSTFANSSSWHFTSPAGIKPDLHHALLSKHFGGGIANEGVICDSENGFGLSADLTGSYQSMDQAVAWDMMVVSY